jgi:hypothetical protein
MDNEEKSDDAQRRESADMMEKDIVNATILTLFAARVKFSQHSHEES